MRNFDRLSENIMFVRTREPDELRRGRLCCSHESPSCFQLMSKNLLYSSFRCQWRIRTIQRQEVSQGFVFSGRLFLLTEQFQQHMKDSGKLFRL